MEALRALFKKYAEEEGYPVAFIGAPARELKSTTSLPIRRVTNGAEMAELVANYTGVRATQTPLIIEDLAFLSPQVHQQLLKFLEESPLEIVVLSTYDVFTPPMLSRMKVFIKAPLERTQSNLLKPQQGRDKINLSKDTHPLDRIRHQGKESPMLYYLDKTVPQRPNRAKLISLIE